MSLQSIIAHHHLSSKPQTHIASRLSDSSLPYLPRHFLLQTSSTDSPVLSTLSTVFFSGCWYHHPAKVGEGGSFYFSQLPLISFYKFHLLNVIQVQLPVLSTLKPLFTMSIIMNASQFLLPSVLTPSTVSPTTLLEKSV